jgi:acetyl-CoA carboxylase carboxyltransferase component
MPQSLVLLTSSPQTSKTRVLYEYITANNARFDGIIKAREWVASLDLQVSPLHGRVQSAEPLYLAEDIFRLVNPDIRKPLDMTEVLLRLVDGSRLSVFKPKYGPNMITARAHILGNIPVELSRVDI